MEVICDQAHNACESTETEGHNVDSETQLKHKGLEDAQNKLGGIPNGEYSCFLPNIQATNVLCTSHHVTNWKGTKASLFSKPVNL